MATTLTAAQRRELCCYSARVIEQRVRVPCSLGFRAAGHPEMLCICIVHSIALGRASRRDLD
eukprot:7554798-Lingulodinium_polyedra.AAC.1